MRLTTQRFKSFIMCKNRILWLDLLICTLWLWAVLGGRYTWSSPVEFTALMAVFLRITVAFLLQKSEARTWLPLGIMSGCLGLLMSVRVFPGLDTLVRYPFVANGISQLEPEGYAVLSILIAAWLWGFPLVFYLVLLFRKKLQRTALTWGDLFGAVLWKDPKARFYAALLLISIAALYTGLAMDARVCRLICLVAPAISYWLLCRHYHISNPKPGLLVVSMLVFYYAQVFSGTLRIGMLGISLAVVIYLGWRVFQRNRCLKPFLAIILYVGIGLPSMSIGYNQYTGIEYARQGFASMEPYDGIFFIRDSTKTYYGLRDRYGILVEPQYEDIAPRQQSYPTFWYQQLELKNDERIDVYDLWEGEFIKTNADNCSEGTENEEISGEGHVCVSEDKRVTIESGVYPDGGTSPDYWSKWTIVNSKGVKHELKFENASYMKNVHALQKSDGTTYYIVYCSGRASSTDGYGWLEAYRIVGDSIKEVNVVDGGNRIDNNDFYVNYSIPDWYHTTNGAGYDWLFDYDSQSGKLYVPIAENQEIIDRYRVWKFNGERFIFTGEYPHKNLHESLEEYNRLICYFTTKDYVVRVDSLDSQELRYASWMKPQTMADAPDIVLRGGKRQQHPVDADKLRQCDDYRFTNRNYEYIVNHCETKSLGEGYGEHHDYLLVRTRDTILLKQEKRENEGYK